MARSHLTLAALAASAMPGADIVATRPISSGAQGRYDSAVLSLRTGDEVIVRVPTDDEAASEQSLDLVALQALTAGVRSRLPFRVPGYEGQAPVGDTRAVVYDFIPGTPASLGDITADGATAGSVGAAIAAVHTLPTSVVTEAGLTVNSASQLAARSRKLAERAAATGKVPQALSTRWALAHDDSALWQFQPSVVNGTLSPESFLMVGDHVSGVLGWSGLAVGDPAVDLFWLSSAATPEGAELVFSAYERALPRPADRQLRKRARLYAELEIARWLLHGLGTRDQGVVGDAESMLASLASSVQSDLLNPLSTDTGQVMAVEEVEALLDRTPVRTSSTADPASRITED
ncbi:phosphotransferase [Cnuibacter physcomitrellae]|uniref:phosphotransferase n=1 Tax=Cnuibacter physcomitrellae TaxID=1619308 RepID=UPI0021759FAF|nr:phosphotransferase [Cnuibacter physcomitrellae]MCS5496603.1 phosphotransferase [Cnuibacter physcomitrellae]